MGYSINTKESHYIEWYKWNPQKGIKGKFITAELYDRKNDPTEKINIAQDPAFAERVAQLSEQLEGGWKAALP